MENFNFPNHTSAPALPENNEKKRTSTNYSSVTHPSICHRSTDHLEKIFKKIKNGDNVFPQIPLRLDPNIEFSDDEDEEPVPTIIKKPLSTDKGNVSAEKKSQKILFPETMKTPERPGPSHARNVLHTNVRKSSNYVRNLNDKLFPSCFPASKVKVGRENSHPTIKTVVKSKDSLFPGPNENVPCEVSKQKSLDLLKKQSNEKEDSFSVINKGPSPTNDIIKVNDKVYNILSLLGSGGSCKVYSVYDVHDKIRVAIKCVNLKDTDPMIRKGFEQEIEYLQKLQNSNRVIKMHDFEYRENELFLVLEHGDIDFAKYLSNEAKLKRLTPLKIKFYWAQMLEAVADIHKYGIVHSDLKPANFLLVAGNLKLIDFGISTSVPEDKTSTFRDTQVGTLNYMSPEAITQMSVDSKQQYFKIGVKSDVWSLGCILYNLVYGTTPFQNIKSLMQKIYAITNPSYEIPFKPLSDPLLLDVLKSCLKRNPKERASVEDLLNHPYLFEENVMTSDTASSNQSSDLQNVLKQMQILTPRRMRQVTKVIQELSVKSNS